MMNAKQIHSMWRSGLYVAAAAILVIAAAVTTPAKAAAAEDTGFALMIQSSPADGGNVMPGDGVHRVQIGGSVPLIAVPKQGYRFLYWLGDVGQTDRTRTSVRMDSPKLVVAVFERERFADEDLLGSGVAQGASYGGLYASAAPGSGGDIESSSWTPDTDGGTVASSDTEEDDPFPVPVQNPEPMTALLLGLGTVLAARRKRG